MMPPTSLNIVGLTATGIGWSARSRNSGLGSNESTCDTPPDMKQKITLFARGAKSGFRPLANDSRSVAESSDDNASEPNPVEQCASICRRDSFGRRVGSMAE